MQVYMSLISSEFGGNGDGVVSHPGKMPPKLETNVSDHIKVKNSLIQATLVTNRTHPIFKETVGEFRNMF